MKLSSIFLPCAVAAAFVISSTTSAADASSSQAPAANKVRTNKEVREDSPLGYVAAPGTAAEEIIILAGKTRHIKVVRLETYRIVNGSAVVVWTFDTFGLPTFPLSKILSGSSDVTVHVGENPMYAN
ncbi:MAG: CzcE family metal-binding protein [Pseudomonadota bacterium]